MTSSYFRVRIRAAWWATLTVCFGFGMALLGGLPAVASADDLPRGLTVEPTDAATYENDLLTITKNATLTVNGAVTLAPFTTTADVTILGSGSLTMTESDATPGISVGSLTIGDEGTGPTITSTIKTTDGFTFNGGTLTATTSVLHKHTIYVGTDFTMTGGSITAHVMNPTSTDYAAGSVITFGQTRGFGQMSHATITGGTLDLTIDNKAIGVGNSIVNGNGILTIGTVGALNGPTVNVTMTGPGFAEGILVHDLIIHSGTLNVNVSTGSMYTYPVLATNFKMDGGRAMIIAAGHAISAISASSTTLSNATGQAGGGPTLTLYGSTSAFTQRESLALNASSFGQSDFYPWVIQSGSSEDTAQIISFAGAANMQGDHGLISSAGQWMRIQPAEIDGITFTSTATSAAPGDDVPLTPYVRFKEGLTPPARFGSSLASMQEIVPVDTTTVTATPEENVSSAQPNGTSGVTATIAAEASGRTTTFTPVLGDSFIGREGSWSSVYGNTPALIGFELQMAYPVTFNGNGGTIEGPPTMMTNAHGLLPTTGIPAAAKDDALFAGWSLTVNGEPIDLSTTVFNQPTTLYARWATGSLALVATPQQQVAGASVNLTLDTADIPGEVTWSVTASEEAPSAGTPAPVAGANGRYLWTVPSGASPDATYEIQAHVGEATASATITVIAGRFATFAANGGAPATQQVIVTDATPLSKLPIAEPSWDRHFFLGWYDETQATPTRLEAGSSITPGATYQAEWATVTIQIDPTTVNLEPREDTAFFTLTITVTTVNPNVALKKGFSASAGELAIKAVDGTATPLEYTAFDYDAGTITAFFSYQLDPNADNGRVSIVGGGTEFHNSVATIAADSSSEPVTPTYSVTLVGNGGTWGESTELTITVAEGDGIAVPEGLIRPGYTLAVWERLVDDEWTLVDLTTYRVFTPVTLRAVWEPQKTVAVYRLWNPYNGAHLITADVDEYERLVPTGWRPEGVKFFEPEESALSIWRVYNPFNGDHLYTTDEEEYERLQGFGWQGEGVKLYGAEENEFPIYRLWNSLQTADGGLGSHLWTADREEYDALPEEQPAGAWKQEGVAWYAAALPLP